MDAPKSLADASTRLQRMHRLSDPHIAPLTAFVETLRAEKGAAYSIPYFDPLDGGVLARVLFLLEAPGRRAVESGFISRNNPDETAKNFFLLNAEAHLPRSLTLSWNAVPWYIGDESRIRAAKLTDVLEASASLRRLLGLLPMLQIVVFVGQKARHAQRTVELARSKAKLVFMPHPSPLFVNRAPGNRERILVVLQKIAEMLTGNAG